jgi:FkbM family methyltransferase
MTVARTPLPLAAQTMLERALIWYARRFPLSRGKLRLIDAFWPLAVADGDPKREATLIYGGFRAPCDLRDMLQRQFYFFGTYYLERELLACWSRLAPKAEIVFDVGANAGIYSIAALAANSRAEVHAFEPTPEIAERLRETVALNGFKTLHVQQMAVAEHSGKATLVRCRGSEGDANDGMNYIHTREVPGGELVNTVSLDAYCDANGIERVDLLKMDIQGSEAAALRGAARLLRERRIGTVFIELNWGAPGTSCSASQSVEILQSNGYLFTKPNAEPAWRPYGEWMRSLSDVVAAPHNA